jgi:arylsulfatase A-like enzyme
VGSESGLDPGLATLAELFAAHGYRTAAVTESVFVSRRYGLDHGFEWFEEHRFTGGKWTLAQTIAAARELVARDDGRPLFLFVHTYRTHQPYRQGPEESSAAFKALVDRIRKKAGDAELDRSGRDAVRAQFVEDYRRLYLDGVRDLDEQLGAFLSELEGGVLRRGLLVFTSDHGESFFEHGRRGHHNDPYEEEIRVPLLLSGGDLSPRDVPFGASLADVAPTLAELCGLSRPAAWTGGSLLTLDRERSLFSHHVGGFRSKVAVVAGARKILASAATDAELSRGLERAELEGAFDLARDPGELDDLRARETWPAELAREIAPFWEAVGRPLGTAAEVSIDAEFAETLRELGY